MSEVKFPENLSGMHIHFVGIKGTGMVALVELLKAHGAFISGSDVEERFYTDEILEKLGIKALPFSEKNINNSLSLVIYSSAYSTETNPDLIAAAKKGIPMCLYSEALGALSASSYSAGICGVHGKTTTTGFAGTLLKEINLPSQALSGSIISSFGNSCTMTSPSFFKSQPGKNRYFVAETCEYRRNFMHFHPSKIILTAVESDHQDFYPTFKDIQNAFVDYICLLPSGGQLIYCADDEGAKETAFIAKEKRNDIELVPYGVNAEGDYHLDFLSVQNGIHSFVLSCLGRLEISVPGDHNVRNAAAATALACELLKTDGKNPEDYINEIKKALLEFAGGKRRSEVTGRAKTPLGQDVIFIDDYGHHPTAIKTTLAGYREFYKNHRIVVDFMSHTYTRTQALLEEFASSFSSADDVIINKIYGSAREDSSSAKVTGKILAEHASKYHPHVIYAEEFDEASREAYKILCKDSGEKFKEGYLFVTMGAGDNWKVGSKLLDMLKENKEN